LNKHYSNYRKDGKNATKLDDRRIVYSDNPPPRDTSVGGFETNDTGLCHSISEHIKKILDGTKSKRCSQLTSRDCMKFVLDHISRGQMLLREFSKMTSRY